jgi:hypothetical protein
MKYRLYTEKTVPECVKILDERIEAKPTSRRANIDGWTERNGDFSLKIRAKVLRLVSKTTRMNGSMNREKGVTTIEGFVDAGISPYWTVILFGVLFLVSGALFLLDQLSLAIIIFVLGGLILLTERQDYFSSEELLIEVEKKLKAKPTPPKTD